MDHRSGQAAKLHRELDRHGQTFHAIGGMLGRLEGNARSGLEGVATQVDCAERCGVGPASGSS